MGEIEYVYPNVSGIPQRGGLLQRWNLADENGCNFIEIPADFIKNKTEIKKTGLDLGGFLTDESIRVLYEHEKTLTKNIKYILHTEPSLPRNDGYGISHQAPLKWYDEEWRKSITDMILSISKFFEIPASAIEIHPGDRRNTFQGLITSIEFLLKKYGDILKTEPIVMIENRTGQFISNGTQINDFWDFLSNNYSHLKEKIGIVLDIQQLYTVTKQNFLEQLSQIPHESIKGFHIHYKHRLPSLSNEIPWKNVFKFIKNVEQDIIINPEIHHKNKVKDTIDFCKSLL